MSCIINFDLFYSISINLETELKYHLTLHVKELYSAGCRLLTLITLLAAVK